MGIEETTYSITVGNTCIDCAPVAEAQEKLNALNPAAAAAALYSAIGNFLEMRMVQPAVRERIRGVVTNVQEARRHYEGAVENNDDILDGAAMIGAVAALQESSEEAGTHIHAMGNELAAIIVALSQVEPHVDAYARHYRQAVAETQRVAETKPFVIHSAETYIRRLTE
jgi:hypothetical protein